MKLKCLGCGLEFKWWENWVCFSPFIFLGSPRGVFYHKRCLPQPQPLPLMSDKERAQRLIERCASQVSTSTPGELWKLEPTITAAFTEARLEDAKYFHVKVQP